ECCRQACPVRGRAAVACLLLLFGPCPGRLEGAVTEPVPLRVQPLLPFRRVRDGEARHELARLGRERSRGASRVEQRLEFDGVAPVFTRSESDLLREPPLEQVRVNLLAKEIDTLREGFAGARRV